MVYRDNILHLSDFNKESDIFMKVFEYALRDFPIVIKEAWKVLKNSGLDEAYKILQKNATINNFIKDDYLKYNLLQGDVSDDDIRKIFISGVLNELSEYPDYYYSYLDSEDAEIIDMVLMREGREGLINKIKKGELRNISVLDLNSYKEEVVEDEVLKKISKMIEDISDNDIDEDSDLMFVKLPDKNSMIVFRADIEMSDVNFKWGLIEGINENYIKGFMEEVLTEDDRYVFKEAYGYDSIDDFIDDVKNDGVAYGFKLLYKIFPEKLGFKVNLNKGKGQLVDFLLKNKSIKEV